MLYFKAYLAATPQRADRVLERCTNAVASPFGVTGSLSNSTGLLSFAFMQDNSFHLLSLQVNDADLD